MCGRLSPSVRAPRKSSPGSLLDVSARRRGRADAPSNLSQRTAFYATPPLTAARARSFTLAFALCAALTACDDDDGGTDTDAASTTDDATTDATTAAGHVDSGGATLGATSGASSSSSGGSTTVTTIADTSDPHPCRALDPICPKGPTSARTTSATPPEPALLARADQRRPS
ncbi:MAG: hypothetical protein IPK80_00820 [Nannocystis sp.]|nr:hypothetical protein [Nannocystis sp.]